MSFYDNSNNSAWSAAPRQASWEHQQQSRSQQAPTATGSSSADPQATALGSRSNPPSALSSPDLNAFASQFEEIERASDNLTKSGRWFSGQANAASANASRRDSAPQNGRGSDYNGEHRSANSSRHHSVGSDFDAGRPNSAGLQGFYAGQRFPSGRPSEAEQVLQAKRRMAAQRERELRNYHQEQQYNRTVTGVKTDRALSPNTMSEDERRDLIARQHRALYGDGSSLYGADSAPRSGASDVRTAGSARGSSPLAYDSFATQLPPSVDGSVQMPPRDTVEGTASPTVNSNKAPFASRTSSSSPTASPPLAGGVKGATSGVAPIGTRPAVNTSIPGSLNKRAVTPLTASSLGYGFASNTEKDDRAASQQSVSAVEKTSASLGGWGNANTVWGSNKNTLAVQPSVWG